MSRHFSFEFYCKDKSLKSLKGLTYNITVFLLTHEAICPTMPETATKWTQFYSHVSLPNLIDHVNKKEAA